MASGQGVLGKTERRGGVLNSVQRVERDDHSLGYSVGKLTTTVRRDKNGLLYYFLCPGGSGDDGSGSWRGAES